MKPYNLIFRRTEKIVLISKNYKDWREIQDEYEDYAVSIDFDSLDQIGEYLAFDYKINKDKVNKELERFLHSSEPSIELDI